MPTCIGLSNVSLHVRLAFGPPVLVTPCNPHPAPTLQPAGQRAWPGAAAPLTLSSGRLLQSLAFKDLLVGSA